MADSESPASPATSYALPKRSGKPADPIWACFTRGTKGEGTLSNRYVQTCKFCEVTFPASTTTTDWARRHVYSCNPKPQHTVAHAEAKAQMGEPPAQKRRGSDSKKAKPQTAARVEEVVQQLRQAVTLLMVTENLPHNVLDSQHLKRIMTLARTDYRLPSSKAFAEQVLPAAYTRAKVQLVQMLQQEVNLTISVDVWTSLRQETVVGVFITTASRKTYLWEAPRAQPDGFAPERIAGMVLQCLAEVEPHRFAALCTCASPLLQRVRELVMADRRAEHLLALRCALDAYTTVLATSVSHPHAAALILRAQHIVSFVRSDSKALRFLAAQQTPTLIPCTTTSVASVLPCLQSVIHSQEALVALGRARTSSAGMAGPLGPDSDVLGDPVVADVAMREILVDGGFYAQLQELAALLKPLMLVTDAVEKLPPRLGDVLRYWAYISTQLATLLGSSAAMPASYKLAVCAAAAQQLKELDVVPCRLALMLDPRYRHAVAKKIEDLIDVMGEAGRLQAARGMGGEASLTLLFTQARKYFKYQPPFSQLPHGGEYFDVRDWWEELNDGQTADFVGLAQLMWDLAPFSRGPGGAGPSARWLEGPQRRSLVQACTVQGAFLKCFQEAKTLVPPTAQGNEQVTSAQREEQGAVRSEAKPVGSSAEVPCLQAQVLQPTDHQEGQGGTLGGTNTSQIVVPAVQACDALIMPKAEAVATSGSTVHMMPPGLQQPLVVAQLQLHPSVTQQLAPAAHVAEQAHSPVSRSRRSTRQDELPSAPHCDEQLLQQLLLGLQVALEERGVEADMGAGGGSEGVFDPRATASSVSWMQHLFTGFKSMDITDPVLLDPFTPPPRSVPKRQRRDEEPAKDPASLVAQCLVDFLDDD